MLYKKTMENRKELVNRLQGLTGSRAIYTRMPECAFVIDGYKVEMDGTLTIAEEADMGPIKTLLAEGMIVPYESDLAEAERRDEEAEMELIEAGENGEETPEQVAPEEPSDGPEEEQAEPLEIQEEEQTESMEGREEEQAEPWEGPEEARTEPREGQEVPQIQPVEGQEEVHTVEEEDHPAEDPEAGTQSTDGEEAQIQITEDDEARPMEPDHYAVKLPMKNHSVTSLHNLVNMVYARAGLISKATGGTFSCTEDLIKDLEGVMTIENLISIIDDHEGELKGLKITSEQIAFTGFPKTEDDDKVQAFTRLAALMNKMAITSKRVLARPVAEDNERYIFRIWLLRLGMAGKEYAADRKILLEPLAGNAAFKDKAMEDRWKAKRKATEQADDTETLPDDRDETPDTEGQVDGAESPVGE